MKTASVIPSCINIVPHSILSTSFPAFRAVYNLKNVKSPKIKWTINYISTLLRVNFLSFPITQLFALRFTHLTTERSRYLKANRAHRGHTLQKLHAHTSDLALRSTWPSSRGILYFQKWRGASPSAQAEMRWAFGEFFSPTHTSLMRVIERRVLLTMFDSALYGRVSLWMWLNCLVLYKKNRHVMRGSPEEERSL